MRFGCGEVWLKEEGSVKLRLIRDGVIIGSEYLSDLVGKEHSVHKHDNHNHDHNHDNKGDNEDTKSLSSKHWLLEIGDGFIFSIVVAMFYTRPKVMVLVDEFVVKMFNDISKNSQRSNK